MNSYTIKLLHPGRIRDNRRKYDLLSGGRERMMTFYLRGDEPWVPPIELTFPHPTNINIDEVYVRTDQPPCGVPVYEFKCARLHKILPLRFASPGADHHKGEEQRELPADS